MAIERKLEIGPGPKPLPGFEGLNIVPSKGVTHVCDASEKIPLPDNTFSIIYASHILEHIPWYKTEEVLKEWVRILKPGGTLEIWVPDGLKICKAFVDGELNNSNEYLDDKWFRGNPDKDVCKWASGRIFRYGNKGNDLYQSKWHVAIFSFRYLKKIFEQTGLINVRKMTSKEVRGYDHKWINLGICGKKP
jgi:ubiquinone/menaquinone biosynthesis C-methylase UbiE